MYPNPILYELLLKTEQHERERALRQQALLHEARQSNRLYRFRWTWPWLHLPLRRKNPASLDKASGTAC